MKARLLFCSRSNVQMGLSVKERMRKCRARRLEKGVCIQCGKGEPVAAQICKICNDKRKAWYKNSDYRTRNAELRAGEKKIVFDHYGGRCACCGETEPCFLAIDHIDGDGNNHRKKIGKWGSSFFKWLIANDFPEGFQVLCHNCNMGKHLNGGECPHKSKPRMSKGILRKNPYAIV